MHFIGSCKQIETKFNQTMYELRRKELTNINILVMNEMLP